MMWPPDPGQLGLFSQMWEERPGFGAGLTTAGLPLGAAQFGRPIYSASSKAALWQAEEVQTHTHKIKPKCLHVSLTQPEKEIGIP